MPRLPADTEADEVESEPPERISPWPGRCLTAVGWVLRWIPDFILQGICGLVGGAIYRWLPRRRRILLSNLHHAYPEMTPRELIAMARQSARRVAEMGLWLLLAPHFSEAALRKRLAVAPEALEHLLTPEGADPEPKVVAIPHTCLLEMLTCVPVLPGAERMAACGVIYRPLNQVWLEQWVRSVRERFGLRMLARRNGFTEAVRLLKAGGVVGILFDQHAGLGGVLTTSMDRLTSASPAGGRLAHSYGARLYTAIIERDTFLRGWLRIVELPRPQSAMDGVVAVEAWLERWLAETPEQRSDWLWMHHRWKTESDRATRFRISAEATHLDQTLALRSWQELPRKTRCWVVVPFSTEGIAAAAPYLRRLRHSRPDFAVTVIVASHLREAAEVRIDAEDWRHYPEHQPRETFRKWAWQFPDTVVVLEPCARIAKELGALRVPQILAMPEVDRADLPFYLQAFFAAHGLPEVS